MKNKIHTIIAIICTFFLPFATFAQPNIEQNLGKIAEIKNISELADSTGFSKKLLVYFEQPVNHKDANGAKFKQRVVIGHVGYDRPTVIVTEGYGGAYALRPKYREEISKLFNANMIFVEHRYFLESTPKPRDWQYLTAENEACDLHEIVTALKKIYPGKWISTGISKGGQNVMIFRTFFPNDVDISVPYVGPLCRAVEDGRHEPFLRKVSTPENRNKIYNFQIEVLKRRAALMPKFKAICDKEKYHFNAPLDEIYDFCVLEYSFAFWQWGSDVNKIPASTASDDEIFKHFAAISGPSYFGGSSHDAFFVQAARELGYYGYDTRPFKGYLTIKNAKNYLSRLMLPDGTGEVKFDKTLYKKVSRFLKKNDVKMIFIYGEIDPWTAAGVTWLKNKKNMKLYIQPNGSHRSRILNMPENMKQEIIDTIKTWLDE